MKVCPNCQTKYPDDANFCPQEGCATPSGPRRLEVVAEPAASPRYELESRVGGGRTGEVWRARDGQTGAAVIWKRVVRAALPTSAALERALRELKQLQRATSPRLARVLDFGRDSDGQIFVVTEVVGGRPLDQVVAASGPLSLDRAKKIIAQIGEALLDGQKVGVVHHDLGAKNVLVADGDEVKVINFIAPVPVTDTIFGVPEYLSPEQAEGKLVDQRSNTYSLGALLTLMLSGRPAVSGADTAAIVAAVQRGEIVPPSRTTAGLPPEIDRVVLKAMDKSPNRRPLTLRQFLTEVSALAAPGTAAGERAGVGFAKTMMFTGGVPEVQKLVNQALAARADAGANGASAATAPALAPTTSEVRLEAPSPGQTVLGTGAAGQTPAPALGPRPSHGAAVAATMVALPAVGARLPGQAGSGGAGAGAGTDPGGSVSGTLAEQSMEATPPPTSAVPDASSTAPTPKPTAGGAFRETLWFKKGDVDQMVADARARVEAARAKTATPPPEAEPEAAAGEDARPLQERYVDDGTVTAEDRSKFSLRAGGASAAMPTLASAANDRMSDAEMVKEIGGGKRFVILVVAIVIALGVVVTFTLGFRHKGGESPDPTTLGPPPAGATEPAAAPAPRAPATPTTAEAPKAAAAEAPKGPAAVEADDADDDDAASAPAPKAHPVAARKHVGGKKAKAGKKRH